MCFWNKNYIAPQTLRKPFCTRGPDAARTASGPRVQKGFPSPDLGHTLPVVHFCFAFDLIFCFRCKFLMYLVTNKCAPVSINFKRFLTKRNISIPSIVLFEIIFKYIKPFKFQNICSSRRNFAGFIFTP